MSKRKKARRAKSAEGYLLVHDQLGVLLGFSEIPTDQPDERLEVPVFSNFEAGGRREALILWPSMRLFVMLDDVKQQMRDFGPEGFSLKPIRCRRGRLFLPMKECRDLGIPQWNEFPADYYSGLSH
jgi:hypothetical protein